jgi:hypothetical protein
MEVTAFLYCLNTMVLQISRDTLRVEDGILLSNEKGRLSRVEGVWYSSSDEQTSVSKAVSIKVKEKQTYSSNQRILALQSK